MLFPQKTLEAIATGAVTLAFRRWKKPTVRPGGELRTGVGVLAIDAVDPVAESEITEMEAQAAGSDSRAELLALLARYPDGQLYRIRFHLAGADPRIALRQRGSITDEERRAIEERLARLDARSPHGPWTTRILGAISAHPETRAGDLAEQCGLPKEWLKVKIRELKELGLTESLLPGYRIAPRGEAFLKARKLAEAD